MTVSHVFHSIKTSGRNDEKIYSVTPLLSRVVNVQEVAHDDATSSRSRCPCAKRRKKTDVERLAAKRAEESKVVQLEEHFPEERVPASNSTAGSTTGTSSPKGTSGHSRPAPARGLLQAVEERGRGGEEEKGRDPGADREDN